LSEHNIFRKGVREIEFQVGIAAILRNTRRILYDQDRQVSKALGWSEIVNERVIAGNESTSQD